MQAAFRRDIEAAADPEARRKELEARFIQMASLLRQPGIASPMEIIDPCDTRPAIVDYVRTQARPGVFVEKEVMTFGMTVPRDVLDEFIAQVLAPMFGSPRFLPEEVDHAEDPQNEIHSAKATVHAKPAAVGALESEQQ